MNKIPYELSEMDAFNNGAHQAMQETRLEIALQLVRQVADEEMSNYLVDAVKKLEKTLSTWKANNE